MHYLNGQAMASGTVPELYQTSRAGSDHNLGACFFNRLHLPVLDGQTNIPMGDTEGTT